MADIAQARHPLLVAEVIAAGLPGKLHRRAKGQLHRSEYLPEDTPRARIFLQTFDQPYVRRNLLLVPFFTGG